MKLLLKNGTIINYANKFQEVADILIENEKIKKIEKNIAILKNFCYNIFIIFSKTEYLHDPCRMTVRG